MVTLYTFYKGGNLYTVYRDDTDFTFIDYFTQPSPGHPDVGPPAGQIITIICAPGTTDKYTYTTSANVPYAAYTVEHNSTYCGYSPPACDIVQVTFQKTDETAAGANDGTVNYFASSSFPPITYYLKSLSLGVNINNSTGYFTGLHPANDYSISALDANGCGVDQFFQIIPFNAALNTHFKYRMQFSSVDGKAQYELRFFDMKNSYLQSQYPVDITGAAEPVVKKVVNTAEDKSVPVIPTSLDISLVYTNQDFQPEEFVVPEKSWRVELWHNGALDFQGWLLPDESQSQYLDAPFEFRLTATDGLASLKGNLFGNGSGGQGYGPYQIPQYGLTQWCKLIKQCLDQLGYSYSVCVLSSLQYNGTYDSNLWLNIGTWSDILYDSSGVPMDTYSALSLLLQGMGLVIFQSQSLFFLVNQNDLYYLQNGVKAASFQNALHRFSSDFSSISANGLSVPQPIVQLVGKDYPNVPIGGGQTINYDKPYNISEDITFSIMALLYTNNSFEVGAVQGQLLPEWTAVPSGAATILAYSQNNPVNKTTGYSAAFDGLWTMRVFGKGYTNTSPYIKINFPINIDQNNKKLKLDFQWKPSYSSATQNPVPHFIVQFTDGSSGNTYYWNQNADTPVWTRITNSFNDNFVKVLTNGNVNWQSFSIETAVFPETEVGTLEFRFYSTPLWNYGATGNFPTISGDGSTYYVDYDDLNMTIEDASDVYNVQTGEKHIITAVLGIATANLKSVNQTLFTYPNNKRVAGNVFYGFNYATAAVANLWNFQLKSADPQDRLPATLTRSLARTYARPMFKWEGDVEGNWLDFYGIFTLQYYDSKVFVPFSLQGNLKSGTWHAVLIEIDDSDAQNIYSYTPVYARSSRRSG